MSLDKPLAISKLLQVPSLDTLLTWGQVIISTRRARVVLSALTPSHADSVQSPPPLMGFSPPRNGGTERGYKTIEVRGT